MTTKKGWFDESHRHEMAAKGILTAEHENHMSSKSEEQLLKEQGWEGFDERFLMIDGKDAEKVLAGIRTITGQRKHYIVNGKIYVPIPKGHATEFDKAAVEASKGRTSKVMLRLPGGYYQIAGKQWINPKTKKFGDM
jgi:hypothetical protein